MVPARGGISIFADDATEDGEDLKNQKGRDRLETWSLKDIFVMGQLGPWCLQHFCSTL